MTMTWVQTRKRLIKAGVEPDRLPEWYSEMLDLRQVELRGADLRGARLLDIDFLYADLRRADLRDANLSGSILMCAYLQWADMRSACLHHTDLENAMLMGANLQYADLWGANLRKALLKDVNLSNAHLGSANLQDAHLDNTDLSDIAYDCRTIGIQPAVEGSLIGWISNQGHVIKVRVPEEARRSCGTTRRYRTERVVVLSIDDGKHEELRLAARNGVVTYRVGETIDVVDQWNPNRWANVGGITFFLTRLEAEMHVF